MQSNLNWYVYRVEGISSTVSDGLMLSTTYLGLSNPPRVEMTVLFTASTVIVTSSARFAYM